MALLKGPPVIPEELLEGVFVDPLPCGGHSAWLYHVLAARSTRLCPFIRLSLPIVSPYSDGEKKGFSKKEILIHDLEGYEPNFGCPKKFSLWNQRFMEMALKNPSANCFRKFKGLQLTFQVVEPHRVSVLQ